MGNRWAEGWVKYHPDEDVSPRSLFQSAVLLVVLGVAFPAVKLQLCGIFLPRTGCAGGSRVRLGGGMAISKDAPVWGGACHRTRQSLYCRLLAFHKGGGRINYWVNSSPFRSLRT